MSELHKTLRLVFRELVEDGIINENPCDQTETPRRDTQERSAVRPSAVRRFVSDLDLASEDEFGYFLAVVMGLRRGEVCALSRRDVDDALKILSIRHNYDHFGNLKEPKTHAGLRSLPLSDTICRAFARHREAQRDNFAGVASKGGRRTFRQGEVTPVIVNRYGECVNRTPSPPIGGATVSRWRPPASACTSSGTVTSRRKPGNGLCLIHAYPTSGITSES